MSFHNSQCNITVYCQVNPSEDRQKVEEAITNVLLNVKIIINENSLQAESQSLETLLKIHETIHSRHSQSAYRKQLMKNLQDDSTWFYLNKQAALMKVVALCSEAEESPMGPLKIILKSKKIEQIIDWLVSNSMRDT